jgi:hypothetical protein
VSHGEPEGRQNDGQGESNERPELGVGGADGI